MWESINPGVSIPPRPSTIRVDAPLNARISAFGPTARIRSPEAATASGQGRREFPVHTLALTTTMVASFAAAARAARNTVAKHTPPTCVRIKLGHRPIVHLPLEHDPGAGQNREHRV